MGFKEWIERNELDKPAWKRKGKPMKCVHCFGLPVIEGATCMIDKQDDSYVFSCGTNEWTIPKNRITNIQRLRNTDIQTYIVDSPGLALLGGLAFGTTGAIVGAAMGKQERVYITERFLVFDYLDAEGQPQNIIMQYKDEKIGDADQTPRKYVKDFERNPDKYSKGITTTL